MNPTSPPTVNSGSWNSGFLRMINHSSGREDALWWYFHTAMFSSSWMLHQPFTKGAIHARSIVGDLGTKRWMINLEIAPLCQNQAGAKNWQLADSTNRPMYYDVLWCTYMIIYVHWCTTYVYKMHDGKSCAGKRQSEPWSASSHRSTPKIESGPTCPHNIPQPWLRITAVIFLVVLLQQQLALRLAWLLEGKARVWYGVMRCICL